MCLPVWGMNTVRELHITPLKLWESAEGTMALGADYSLYLLADAFLSQDHVLIRIEDSHF